MASATSVKEAIARFEEAEYRRRTSEMSEEEKANAPRVVAAEEPRVLLIGMLPPIVKMDKDIATLVNCEHLGLSTNGIEKIGPGLRELKKLKILSLGRNVIRKIEQLDIPQLEQLWLRVCDGASCQSLWPLPREAGGRCGSSCGTRPSGPAGGTGATGRCSTASLGVLAA
ncbi:putative dynein light chain [Trypanosoma cruzi]|uniref:Putative dynein light chain n=1 Tax=Trypanosoma cruzi TaxID=5693 RepID=A0A2V2XE09_TRYCR|nr:putative dynein light chain [Trypanosoma cruzi]